MAPLPADKTAWPPANVSRPYARMAKNLAWYGGDIEGIAGAYGGAVAAPVEVQRNEGTNWVTRLGRQLRGEFWSSTSPSVQDQRHHVPIAEEIARTKATLVMADPPRFVVEGPLWEADATELDTDGEPVYRKGDAKPETAAAQRRLDYLLNACNAVPTLIAAIEVGAVLGFYGLRVAFDEGALGRRAVLTSVDATHVVPEYDWGQLLAVTFWRVVARDERTVWRHLERHEKGRVYHGLYRSDGTDGDGIGTRVELTSRPETADLAVGEDGSVLMNSRELPTGVSVPNALPDPLDLDNNAGRSDFTPAVQGLMSSADQFLTQLMNAVDDAQSRLVISDYLLQSNGRGSSLGWDKDTRTLRRVNMPPGDTESGRLPIEQIQFDMKVAEYLMGVEKMRELAIYAAGYNSQTFGEQGTVPQTATEYAGKNKRSMSTRQNAIGYLQPMLEATLSALVATDIEKFAPQVDGDAFDQGVAIQAYNVRVVFPEAVQPTFDELAASAVQVKATGATQLEVVKVLYPDYTDAKQRAMAEERKTENQASDPGTFGLAPATEAETANNPADPLNKPETLA